jgi:hypothetical protein
LWVALCHYSCFESINVPFHIVFGLEDPFW